jgi:predicted O-methyltransferase YrrM
MLSSGAPSTSPSRPRCFASHLRLYFTRRFVTPFSETSTYGKLDRWLTWNLLIHPSWWRIGGYMTPYQAQRIAEFAGARGINRIGQIGFLAGHFVCSTLTILPDATVVSFDLGDHKHSRAAARWITRHFPSRSTVIWGSSRDTLRPYADQFGDDGLWLPFELIVVDGDHTYHGARADLEDVWTLCKKGTYVFMDDLGVPDGVAFDNGPRRAWDEAIAAGRIELVEEFTQSDGHVFAVGRVTYPDH